MLSHCWRSLWHNQKGTVRHFAQYNTDSRRLKEWFLTTSINLHLIQTKTQNTTYTHAQIYLSVCPSISPSFLLSVRPPACTRLPQWRILMKFDIWVFRKFCRESSSCIKIWKEKSGILHEDRYTFTRMIKLGSILLRMRNVSVRICRENQNSHFMFHKLSVTTPHPPPENGAVYWIMWKNMVRLELTRDENMLPHMCFPWWIPNTTNTHPECVIVIVLPLQQWLMRKRLIVTL